MDLLASNKEFCTVFNYKIKKRLKSFDVALNNLKWMF